MTTDGAEDVAPRQRFNAGGCALRVLIAIVVLTAMVVVIGTIFDQGDSADQPVRGFDAGLASDFPLADVQQFDEQHLFIVRLQDGEFLALYDKSSKQQELGGDCRLRFDDKALLGTLEPLRGFTGAFVEDCESLRSRSVWRVDGVYSFGSNWGDMDRYSTSVNADGHLIVDTRTRSCTRSRGVAGAPPFDVKQCGRGE